jgi:hypothetical protein
MKGLRMIGSFPMIIDDTRPNHSWKKDDGYIGIGQLNAFLGRYKEFMKDIKGLNPGARLKYGAESDPISTYYAYMQASVNLYPLSSYFVTVGTTSNAGYHALTTASSASIQGHLICPSVNNTQGSVNSYYTTSATLGVEAWPCIFGMDVRFRIPVGSGTCKISNVGLTFDLVVTNGVQAGAVQVSTEHHLVMLACDTTNNSWVDCRLNPAIMNGAGTAS